MLIKKPTWQRTSHSQSLLSGERSSEKNNLSKIEKTGGRQQAYGLLALAPYFFNFWKIVFFWNSDRIETEMLFFFCTPNILCFYASIQRGLKDPSKFKSYRAIAGASQQLKLYEYVILDILDRSSGVRWWLGGLGTELNNAAENGNDMRGIREGA